MSEHITPEELREAARYADWGPDCSLFTRAAATIEALEAENHPAQPVGITDEMVERAARAISGAPFPSARSIKKARAALEAALGGGR